MEQQVTENSFFYFLLPGSSFRNKGYLITFHLESSMITLELTGNFQRRILFMKKDTSDPIEYYL